MSSVDTQLRTTKSWSVADLRDHIEDKFADNVLEFSPFPHMIIGNFFPDEVYREILSRNLFLKNRGKEWFTQEQLAQRRSSSPYDHRLQINFHEKDGYEGDQEHQEFWGMLTQVFLKDSWFPKLVASKFPAYFAIR